jgi:hypothetical protein
MAERYNRGSHYENHQRAAELQNAAAHAHRAAEHEHGKEDHLTDTEQSREEVEHSGEVPHHSRPVTVGHGVAAFGHEDIAELAYELWEARGCPHGSPEVDWFHAVKELRSRAIAHSNVPFVG